MKFTLAVCTYNRAALLTQALDSLAACRAPADEWELLLIDNNSGDYTRAVAESFLPRLPLRYIFEPIQGLSTARNRALRECRGDVLLFTDDDVRFDVDWLQRYQHAFSAQLGAGWFGGRIRPLWRDGSPAWLQDEGMALIAGLMVRYDLGAVDRPFLSADPTPFGASFALRRSAFELTGEFRTDLGVNGSTPGRGEEAEYLLRLKQAGIPGFYVGTSSAWHWQDPARFSWKYLYRHGVQKGIAETRMNGTESEPDTRRLMEVAYAIKAVVQLIKGRGDRARQCVINMGIMRGIRHR